MKKINVQKEAVCIVIPTYNEKENIQNLIESILKIVVKATIIVVDDNSSDGTKETLIRLRKKYINIFFIERESKLGRGSAVIEGFRYGLKNTKAKIFIEMDADFSHDPKELPSLIKNVTENRFVIGSRYLVASRICGWSLSRRILSKLANSFISLLLRFPIHDYTNGYRAYGKKAAETLIKQKFLTSGYILLSESILLLYSNRFNSIEIPTIFVNRREGTSKASPMEFINSFLEILKLRIKYK
jgi:dolichol-phosphate mannosyltransferase